MFRSVYNNSDRMKNTNEEKTIKSRLPNSICDSIPLSIYIWINLSHIGCDFSYVIFFWGETMWKINGQISHSYKFLVQKLYLENILICPVLHLLSFFFFAWLIGGGEEELPVGRGDCDREKSHKPSCNIEKLRVRLVASSHYHIRSSPASHIHHIWSSCT